MRVHVYIPTTQGPVAIQSVTEEEPDVQSVVCVDGGIEPLPISARYHDFVRKGTGILHKEFGCGAYRVDVSGRVDQGNSWQLPVYIAHYLHRAGVLGNGCPEAGDKVIWATGTVKADKTVTPVERIPSKIGQSLDLFQRLQEKNVDVLLMLPAANNADLQDKTGDFRTELDYPAKQQGVDSLEAATAHVEGFINPRAAADSGPDISVHESGKAKAKIYWMSLLTLSILLGAGYISAIKMGWLPLRSTGEQVVSDAPQPKAPTLPETNVVLDDFSDPVKFEEKRRQWGAVQPASDQPSTRLVVKLSQFPGDCNDAYTVERELTASRDEFPTVPIERLCSIAVEPADNILSVLGVSLDNGAIVPITPVNGVWHISKPRISNRTRDYILLTLENVSLDEARAALSAAVPQMRSKAGYRITLSQIQDFTVKQGWKGHIYRQTLQYSEADALRSNNINFFDY